MPPKSKSTKVVGGSSPTAQFVLLSDLHAHAWTAFARGDGRDNSRLRRSLVVLAESLERARELRVPWVFAGDIVHTAGYTLNVVMSELVDVLCQYSDVVKLAVWGNHDARGVGGRITLEQTVLSTLNRAVPQFFVLDPSALSLYTDPKTGLTFSGAGYQPHGNLLEYGMPADVGVYHQTVRGSTTAHGFRLEEGVSTEELLKRHRVSVVGHVHHWQYLGDDQRVLIPGSPEHHNFGDMGEHGWWVIAVPPKGVIGMSFANGGSPEFRTVPLPKDVKKDGNFYRVLSVPDGTSVPKGALAIAPVTTVIENRDILQGARGVQALDVWLKTEPPTTALSLERYSSVGASLLGSYEINNLQALRLKVVRIKNFCSYEEQTFTVQDGTWLVVGKGRDFPSNGAGKSTLFEAAFWALFGRTTKGLTGDEVIRWGTEDCSVEVELEDGQGGWLRVLRSRGDGSDLVVEGCSATAEQKWTLEGKSVVEVTEKLGQHLGLTPELYQALGYFSQEKLLLFASSTDGERKDMLADLIGLSAYQEAASAAQRRVAELEVEEGRLEGSGASLAEQLESERRALVAIVAQSAEWTDDWQTRVTAAQAAVRGFEKTIGKERKRLATAARETLGGSIADRLADARAAVNIQRKIATLRSKPVTSTLKDLSIAQQQNVEATMDVKRILLAIEDTVRQRTALDKRINAQRDLLASGKCPSCRQAVSEEHQAQCLAPALDDLADLIARIEELQTEQKHAADRAITLQKGLRVVEAGVVAAEQLNAQAKELELAEANLASVEREWTELDTTVEWHVDKTIREAREDLEQVVQRILAEQDPHAGEERGTKERIKRAEVAIAAQQSGLQRLREEIDILEYWRHGFSKQGIQSLLVDEVAGLFNDTRGSIFPALTQGVYDVQFSTCSQTKQGEWRERTEFQIYERGELVPYSALSGGQRRRVDVGVMLTLVKAVSAWMQVPGVLGVLVLDEVFGFLDGSGAEGLMEALREVQKQIPAIYVVSHEPQLQALFPAVVVVEQGQDGVSRILNEEGA